MGNIAIPGKCDGQVPCTLTNFVCLTDSCKYIDQQTLKLQESPEAVPTGEMPRNILLAVDRFDQPFHSS